MYEPDAQNRNAKFAKKAEKYFWVFVVIAVLFSGLIWISQPKSKPFVAQSTAPAAAPAPAPKKAKTIPDRSIDAFTYAQIFVKENLKAPATAKFAGLGESRIERLPDGETYKVYSYVDSQNSFGAMLRSKYYVKVIVKSDMWKILDVVIK